MELLTAEHAGKSASRDFVKSRNLVSQCRKLVESWAWLSRVTRTRPVSVSTSTSTPLPPTIQNGVALSVRPFASGDL